MAVQGSFQGFQRLNDFTHLYQPNVNSNSKSVSISDCPELIILCAWAFARPKHITKYIVAHQTQFHAAEILLLQSETSNLLWRPDRMQMPLFAPAVEAVKRFRSKTTQTNRRPRILLHVFSNGGSHSAVQLAQAYRESFLTAKGAVRSTDTDSDLQQLPISAIVFDSCPGNTSYALSVKAISQGLPSNPLVRFAGMPLVYGFIGLCGFLHETGFCELAVSKLWRCLNDTDGAFLRPNLPRTYVYSAEDPVVEYQDVLEHARIARQRLGLSETGNDEMDLIRTVQVVGGRHVNHMSIDPAKYWQIVKETWDRSSP